MQTLLQFSEAQLDPGKPKRATVETGATSVEVEIFRNYQVMGEGRA